MGKSTLYLIFCGYFVFLNSVFKQLVTKKKMMNLQKALEIIEFGFIEVVSASMILRARANLIGHHGSKDFNKYSWFPKNLMSLRLSFMDAQTKIRPK